MRLIAGSGVLAVYVAVLYPAGLLDESPTVLGLRTFVLTNPDTFDSVVPVSSLLSRLERVQSAVTDAAAPVTVSLPAEVHTVTWAAISPPRGGWATLPGTSSALLESVARAGIDEVAAAIPAGTGEQIVHRVRSEVWGREIEGLEHVPAGAGFAAFSLGFLGAADFAADSTADAVTDAATATDAVAIYETGPWTRLTTKRGHVLVKRRAWTLAR